MINEKAFIFPFEDKNWVSKFLIGGLLILVSYVIPIIPLVFVFGYIIRAMRHTIETGESRLPEWENWTDLGVKGVLGALIYFIYLLPGLVLLFGSLASFGLSIAMNTSIPSDMGYAITAPISVVGKLLLLLGIAALAAAVLVLLVGWLMTPIAIARFAATEEVSAALDVAKVWAIIRAQLENFIITWAVYLGLGYVSSMLYTLIYYTVCCCILIPFLSAPISLYLLIFSMTLFARVYREGVKRLPGEPLLLSTRADSVEQAAPGKIEEKPSESRRETEDAQARHKGSSLPPAKEEQAEKAPRETTVTPKTEERKASGQGASSYERTINELEISSRVERLLLENGFVTIGQLLRSLEKDETELLDIKGFGTKALEELKTQLKAKGFLK